MKRRAGAAAAGLLALMVALLVLGPGLEQLGAALPTILLLAFPAAGIVGSVVCARVARAEWRAAVTILAFIYGSWFAVPLFTLVDRPHWLFSLFALSLSVGGVVLGGVATAVVLRGRYRPETPTPLSYPRAFARVAVATCVGLVFMWLSFMHGSFWLALPAVYAYVLGRASLEGLPLGPLRSLPGHVDKLAFACVIGVTVRTSAAQVYQTNLNVLSSADRGQTTRLDRLEPAVAKQLVDHAREFHSVRELLGNHTALQNQSGAANALERCADGGNPHCQVLFAMYLREVQGPLRNLERARHYTWLALRDHHHPIAFNNMLVYLHEAAPEPYSEWLNELQSPENVDRVNAGCGS